MHVGNWYLKIRKANKDGRSVGGCQEVTRAETHRRGTAIFGANESECERGEAASSHSMVVAYWAGSLAKQSDARKRIPELADRRVQDQHGCDSARRKVQTLFSQAKHIIVDITTVPGNIR